MLVSLAIAFVVPFELFLFSYAVIGPLHYLTEINWLHARNYFTLRKNDVWFLVTLCVVATLMNFIPTKNSFSLVSYILTISLYLSVLFVLVKNHLYRLIFALPGIILFHRINDIQSFQLFVGLYLPTLIHVLIFTWLFMIYGILKEPSKAGWLSVFILVVCIITIFSIPAPGLQYPVSNYVKNALGPFALVNFSLVNHLTHSDFTSTSMIYQENAGFVVMRFIAFAYTYHYLNWFSKTSVIRWHKTERKRMMVILLIWLLSVAVYAYDYITGMKVLFFLSFLHVFLEFPLNILTIKGIVQLALFKK